MSLDPGAIGPLGNWTIGPIGSLDHALEHEPLGPGTIRPRGYWTLSKAIGSKAIELRAIRRWAIGLLEHVTTGP